MISSRDLALISMEQNQQPVVHEGNMNWGNHIGDHNRWWSSLTLQEQEAFKERDKQERERLKERKGW